MVVLQPRSLGDVGPMQVLRLGLGPAGRQVQDLLLLRDRVQALLAGLCPDLPLTTTNTVTTCLEFFLKQTQHRKATLEEPLDESSGFPIYLQLHLRPSQKKQVESDIAKASVLLGLQQTGKLANCNQLLASLFTLAMDKKEQLAEFLDKRARQCGVCGAVAEGPEPWCSNCATFHDSVRPEEVSGWQCQEQQGYCAVLHSFQYKDHQLYFTSPSGEVLQYVTNCHVLCRKCRYRRCEAVGRQRPPGCPEQAVCCCVVCRSTLPVNTLGICSPCQMFLTDSVEESSQDSIACMRGNHCLVTAAKTVGFSACTGCWMARMKQQGILAAFLQQEEQRATCCVCDRKTDESHCGRACCAQCKKFFLRCAKTKCFKDFICAGECAGVGQCSQCWWSRCLQVGLSSACRTFGPVPETKRPDGQPVGNGKEKIMKTK